MLIQKTKWLKPLVCTVAYSVQIKRLILPILFILRREVSICIITKTSA